MKNILAFIHKKIIWISVIFIVLALTFIWNKFSSNPAIGEWQSEYCMGKYNLKENLMIFKDNTAIHWLRTSGQCKISQTHHITCSNDMFIDKSGCNWSEKNNGLIVLECHENNTVNHHRTFKLVSNEHALLDGKSIERVTPNTNDDSTDIFQVPLICD